MDSTIKTRITGDELERLEQAAKVAELSLSALLREGASRYADILLSQQDSEPVRVVEPVVVPERQPVAPSPEPLVEEPEDDEPSRRRARGLSMNDETAVREFAWESGVKRWSLLTEQEKDDWVEKYYGGFDE